jgi:hypothetical protein
MCETEETRKSETLTGDPSIKQAFDEVVEYYKSINVPFHTDELRVPTSLVDNPKMKYSIVIPGGMIIFRTFSTFQHTKSIKSLDLKIQKIRDGCDISKLYIFIINRENNEIDLDYYYDMFGLESDNNDIIFVTHVNQIEIKPYVYLVDSSGPLYTMAHNDSIIPELKNTKCMIYIIESTYYHASTIMTDRELDNLHRYKFELINSIDSIPANTAICTVTKYQTKIDIKTCANNFTLHIKYVPLAKGGAIAPFRLIDGHTDRCLNCCRIMYIQYLSVNKICKKCVETPHSIR